MSIESILNDFVKGELTLRAALEQAMSVGLKDSDSHILWRRYRNKTVFIRTVTHHYTGLVTCVADGFIALSDASWIADDGRFNECLAAGKLNEVEPYPDECLVSIGSIVDICQWMHPLPRSVK